MTQTMHAMVIDDFGGPDVFRQTELPTTGKSHLTTLSNQEPGDRALMWCLTQSVERICKTPSPQHG